jgi:hypothetical protein
MAGNAPQEPQSVTCIGVGPTSLYILQEWSPGALVGKSGQNSVEFCDYSNSGPSPPLNVDQNFIFLIVKLVPANSEHISAILEYLFAIDSSNFMHRKRFPPFLIVSNSKAQCNGIGDENRQSWVTTVHRSGGAPNNGASTGERVRQWR